MATSTVDLATLLDLAPEYLGAKFLHIMITGNVLQNGMVHPMNARDQLLQILLGNAFGPAAMNRQRNADLDLVYAEAMAWLTAQGLLVPAPSTNGISGWLVLSRRAKAFADEQAFIDHAIGSKLPRELLHSTVRDDVWREFVHGKYDLAVFSAMKQVEVSMREACSLGQEVIGVTLASKAFNPTTGILTDKGQIASEREGRHHLFAGAIGCYKNPTSHRHVALSDPAEAIELIMLANHLLRIIDDRHAALAKQA